MKNNSNKAIIIRGPSTDQGTFGTITLNNGQDQLTLFISELPDRGNIKQYSRIPEGSYPVGWALSPKFGWVYHVRDVPNRGNILIHSGNYVGDTKKGFRSHSHGCLLPSMKRGILDGQQAGLMSGMAVTKLQEFFKRMPFMLEIVKKD